VSDSPASVPVNDSDRRVTWLLSVTGNEFGNGTGKDKNWIGRQWDYNEELYPSGGRGFVDKMGNISMVCECSSGSILCHIHHNLTAYFCLEFHMALGLLSADYTNGFNQNNSYKSEYRMVGRGEMEPHPTESLRMYGDLIGNATQKYNMEMLFTDFLCYRCDGAWRGGSLVRWGGARLVLTVQRPPSRRLPRCLEPSPPPPPLGQTGSPSLPGFDVVARVAEVALSLTRGWLALRG
jgi:hypothetical protein